MTHNHTHNLTYRKAVTAFAALVLATSMTATSLASPITAASPTDAGQTPAQLNGVDEETWAGLYDDVLKYDEIQNLVHFFNPSISYAWDTFRDGVNDVKSSHSDLKDLCEVTEKMLKEAPEKYATLAVYDPETYAQIIYALTVSDTAAKAAKSQYGKMNTTMSKAENSYNRAIYDAEDMVANAVCSLMIGYDTVRVQREMLEGLAEMYTEMLTMYSDMQSQGMATDTDVQKASADLLSSQSTLSSIRVTEDQLYRQLITLCGWQPDAKVTIGSVPPADKKFIEMLDPEADYIIAINNSSTIKSMRNAGEKTSAQALANGGYTKKSTGKQYETRTEQTVKDEIHADMIALYNDIFSAEIGIESADAGLKSAELARKAGKTQFELGLINKAQQLGIEISYKQKYAAYRSAQLNLVSALLTYDSKMKGN